MTKILRVIVWGTLVFATAEIYAHTTCDSLYTNKPIDAWAGKTVVLDTNVILNDPLAIHKFPGAHVVISGTVFEEVDRKKLDPRLSGASRKFSHELMAIFEKAKSTREVPFGENGSTISLDVNSYTNLLADSSLDPQVDDNKILATALGFVAKAGAEKVFIISEDNNVRLKALGLGIQTQRLEPDETIMKEHDASELLEFKISDDQMRQFLMHRELPKPENLAIQPNEFVQLSSPSTPASDKTVARFHFERANPEKLMIRALPNFEAMGLPSLPLNLEQAMALDVLLDDSISCVIIEAKAGTGKTYLTMMAAMAWMKSRKGKGSIYLSKPTVYVGQNNPGALPGDLDEKYSEWMKSYLDNLAKLQAKGQRKGQVNYAAVMNELPHDMKLLAFEFIRGRSLDDAFIVVDEFQNTNGHEAKTFLTRTGERSKIVILGDVSQIDVSPNHLNINNSGLTRVGTRLTRQELAMNKRSHVARVRLTKGVRSEFSDMVADEL